MRATLLGKILLFSLRSGLLLTLISPLLFSEKFFFPYIVPRTTVFHFLVELLSVGTVFLLLFFPNFRPRWNSLVRNLLIFLAVALLATITSADPSKSFTGTIERYFGFFTLLHFGAFFFIATVAWRTRMQWNVFLGLSTLVSVYAAADFLKPLIFDNSNSLSPSVTGNPTFLAGYLLLHLFFAAELITCIRKRWIQIIFGISIIILTSGILFSGVRGAFLGLCAGIGYLLIYTAYSMPRLRFAFLITAVGLLLSYALLFINRQEPFVQNNAVLKRITNFSLSDETIRARFAMWRMAISGFKENPILGWGRENFSLVFNRHFDTSFEKANVGESWEDRTHNIIFEELVNGGLLGVSAYLLLFGTVFFMVRKRVFPSVLLIAYFVSNLFGVDTFNTYLPFFIFLAYTIFLHNERPPTEPYFSQPNGPFILGACGLLVALIMSGVFTLQIARGNMAMRDAGVSFLKQNYEKFESAYVIGKKALKNAPAIKTEALSIIGAFILQNFPIISQNLQAATPSSTVFLNDFAQSVARNPLEQRFTTVFVQLLISYGAISNTINLIDRADALLADVRRVTPQRKLFLQLADFSRQIREQLTAKSAPATK